VIPVKFGIPVQMQKKNLVKNKHMEKIFNDKFERSFWTDVYKIALSIDNRPAENLANVALLQLQEFKLKKQQTGAVYKTKT
jgi:hypothetical protein